MCLTVARLQSLNNSCKMSQSSRLMTTTHGEGAWLRCGGSYLSHDGVLAMRFILMRTHAMRFLSASFRTQSFSNSFILMRRPYYISILQMRSNYFLWRRQVNAAECVQTLSIRCSVKAGNVLSQCMLKTQKEYRCKLQKLLNFRVRH